MYAFLGEVNLFHGRLHKGRAWIDEIKVDAPKHIEAEELAAVAYVRPYDIHVDRVINGSGALAARVSHILSVGPVVRLELIRDGDKQQGALPRITIDPG